MSHELRTPLNAITLYSEMLHENAVAEDRTTDAEDLAKVQIASKHLLGLINGILDLSKIEAGKMTLDLDTFHVRQMIDDLISTMGGIVRENGNAIHLSCNPSTGTMHADATKVRQILFNLLSNAAKFTKNGDVSLDVDRVTVDGAECIRFVVTDTGIGITRPPEQRMRLFERRESSPPNAIRVPASAVFTPSPGKHHRVVSVIPSVLEARAAQPGCTPINRSKKPGTRSSRV